MSDVESEADILNRLQEVVAFEGQEEGRIPRTVDCELTEDLVDTCVPGDVVTICGIVKVINTDLDMGGGELIKASSLTKKLGESYRR